MEAAETGTTDRVTINRRTVLPSPATVLPAQSG